MSSSSSHLEEIKSSFAAARAYILACPCGKDHPAIQAALSGLDRELRNRLRDAKLQSKFAGTPNTVGTTTTTSNKSAASIHNDNNKTTPSSPDNMHDDDWETILPQHGLAQSAVATLAHHQIRVSSPLQALTVVLHAVLLDYCGAVCTGVPETKPSSGFAPAIRPIAQFLPAQSYIDNNTVAQLRYRHESGVRILRVEQTEQDVCVRWSGPKQQQDNPTELTVPTTRHLNAESFAKATKPTAPALHYKQLGVFLAQFVETFGLKQKQDNNNMATPYRDTTVAQLSTRLPQPAGFAPPAGVPQPAGLHGFAPPAGVPQPAGLHGFPQPAGFPHTGPDGRPIFQLPQARRPVAGDFGGDLLPPSLVGGPSTGNLLGPHHPMFRPNGSLPDGHMQPRFDPFGPPPTDPRRDPFGSGAVTHLPNGKPIHPDVLPPNTLNSNMYL